MALFSDLALPIHVKFGKVLPNSLQSLERSLKKMMASGMPEF